MTTQRGSIARSAMRNRSAQRAAALLGDSPMLTFTADPNEADVCCSVRLERCADGTYIGLVSDHSHFIDRVRLGMQPQFVSHYDAHVSTLRGEARVRILCRIGVKADVPECLSELQAPVVRRLLAWEPFVPSDWVVIEVHPDTIAVDEAEQPVHGAIPRT